MATRSNTIGNGNGHCNNCGHNFNSLSSASWEPSSSIVPEDIQYVSACPATDEQFVSTEEEHDLKTQVNNDDLGSLASTISSSCERGRSPPNEIKDQRVCLPSLQSNQLRRSKCRSWNPSYSWKEEEKKQRAEAAVIVARPAATRTRFDAATDDDKDPADLDAAERGGDSSNNRNNPTSQIDHLSPTNDDDDNGDENHSKGRANRDTVDNTNDSNDTRPRFTQTSATDSKYDHYACTVDSRQFDRSVEIQLASMARPHMRAFHFAWIAFFIAFFTWFAITPLLTEVQHSLQLTKREVWTSSIFGVAGSAMTRILIGPICDKYGARWAMTGTLLMSAIPTAFLGVVQTARGLNVLRLMIGVAGSAFVTCQYWTSSMFSREVAGTANALVAGWGNLGGGVTQIVMGSLLFPLFKVIYGGDLHADGEQQTPQDLRAADLAWRTVCVVPAILCVVIAYLVVKYSDDSPMGNYQKRNRLGFKPSVSARWSLQRAFSNLNTWILAVQYGCCFGVEITMVNAAALYFKEEFDLSTESAAAIASIFGWMNLFARGMGGFASDIANAKLGMRGRLWVQSIFLVLEGALVILFSSTRTLAGAICVMVVFSVLVSAAEGSTFGIVTYVHPVATGSIAGVVGAGGNVGGVAFSILCREYDYRQSFTLMGWVVMSSAVLTGFIRIQGHASLCSGKDAPEVTEHRNNHTEKYGTLPNVALKAPVDGDQSFRGSSVAQAEVLESASFPSS